MSLAEALLPLLAGGRGTIAAVGAGGKTSALFRLAEDARNAGRRVLLTATTHLMDPRLERRPALELILRPDLEAFATGAELPEPRPGLTVLMARSADAAGKLKGIDPGWIPALAASWDLVLVEADGSKRLPLKAPADHEPRLPESTGLVLGVLGLDGLGRPMDAATVHRPERFQELTGCAPGQPIGWCHLAALVRHPQGLFKGVTGPRALLLNKSDRLPVAPEAADLAGLGLDRVLLAALASSDRVMVWERGRQL